MPDEITVREQAQRFIDALHALEVDTTGEDEVISDLDDLFADDANLTNAALKLAHEERKGREEIRAFWRDYKKTLGKSYSHFHQVIADDTAAGLFWVTKGTDAGGHPDSVYYDGATLLTFDDVGRITFLQGYYDTRQLNQELGFRENARR
jgi:hypothetical protein